MTNDTLIKRLIALARLPGARSLINRAGPGARNLKIGE